MINEKQNEKFIAKNEFAISHKNHLKKIDFTNINTNQQNHEIKIIEKFDAFFEIFENMNTMKKTSQRVSHIYKN